jgi:hypothetical protein
MLFNLRLMKLFLVIIAIICISFFNTSLFAQTSECTLAGFDSTHLRNQMKVEKFYDSLIAKVPSNLQNYFARGTERSQIGNFIGADNDFGIVINGDSSYVIAY